MKLQALIVCAALSLMAGSALAGAQVDVHKSPYCGCCGIWVEHLRAQGFEVKTYDVEDVPGQRRKLGRCLKPTAPATRQRSAATLSRAMSRPPTFSVCSRRNRAPSIPSATRRPDLQTYGYVGSKWQQVEDVPYDGVTGDKGIFTTAWDLYLFDQALNHGILLDKSLLDECYKGYSYEKPGQKNYGLGWRLREFEDSSRIIYHNGWWRGYNTLFVRQPEQGTSIIVLSNKLNRNVYDVSSLYEMLGLGNGLKAEESE